MADTGRLDELKRKFDENPRRYFAPLANEYRKAGEFDRAIELCRAYLPHQPGHMSGYIVYGQSLFDAGRGHEAAEIFQQALHLDPENIIALRHLGDIARLDGDKALAMQWYGRVLDLDPKNEEITAYITGLAINGAAAAPARPAPPTIRPEPEPDPEAVALADLVEQADKPQARFEVVAAPVEEPVAEAQDSAPAEQVFDVAPEEPSISEFLMDRSKIAFEYVPEAEAPTAAAAPEASSPDEFDFPEPIVLPQLSEAQAVDEVQAMEAGLGSDMAMDDNAWATADEPPSISAAEPIAELAAEPVAPIAEAPVEPTTEPVEPPAPTADELVPTEPPSESVLVEASPDTRALEPVTDLGAPFITETMATLYLQQGFTSEALDVYRKLAAIRDEPRLHEKVRELELLLVSASDAPESEPAHAPVSRETVREFFARLGARRPDSHDIVTLPASAASHAAPVDIAESPAPASGLSGLFSSTQLDERDIHAADALSSAFSPVR